MKLYKQEGKMDTYQVLGPISACGKLMQKYLPASYGELWVHVKKRYGRILLQSDRMQQVAQAFLKLGKNGFPPGWEKHWKELDKQITIASRDISTLDLSAVGTEELRKRYEQLFALDQDMWAMSIFIDVFDAGYDQEEIQRIAREHALTDEEVHVLLSPELPTYVALWGQALHDVKTGKCSAESVAEQFFWYGTDYADFAEITPAFVKKQAKHAEKTEFFAPTAQQQAILKKHSLKQNPLQTFKVLAEWRDERKRLNFTCVYGLVRLLREGLRRCGIPPELSNGVLTTETKDVFSCKIAKETLAQRLKEGVLLHFDENSNVEVIEGKQGEAEFNRLLQFIPAQTGDVKGMSACKGKAQGIVRIIMEANSDGAKRMQKGDILVTSMTRPEFVPLMKKAGAIITDEGGISCHAAIVSRELGIPCIIGTRVATKVLKDGDIVEVDADKGVVKKVKP